MTRVPLSEPPGEQSEQSLWNRNYPTHIPGPAPRAGSWRGGRREIRPGWKSASPYLAMFLLPPSPCQRQFLHARGLLNQDVQFACREPWSPGRKGCCRNRPLRAKPQGDAEKAPGGKA